MSMRISRRGFLKLIIAAGALAASGGLGNMYLEMDYNTKSFKREMPDSIYDTAIVLGAGVTNQGELPPLGKQRADAVVPIFYNKKIRKFLLSGGYTKNFPRSEAKLMAERILNKGGISSSDLLLEEKSRTTTGNAYYSKVDFLEPNKYFRNVLVTDSVHMPRASLIFQKILGNNYDTKLYDFEPVLPDAEIRNYTEREKGYFKSTKMGLLFVGNGDHEGVRKLFSTLGVF